MHIAMCAMCTIGAIILCATTNIQPIRAIQVTVLRTANNASLITFLK